MDDETASLAGAIGARLKQERTTRHWTLDRLAEAAGVSRRMVINIEQGATNPSIGTLLRLTGALGIGLPTLVEPPPTQPIAVTRSGEGATLWQNEHGGRGVLVASTTGPDVVELWEWTLAPGDRLQSEAHSAGTEELLHVLTGTLTVTVGDEQVDLAAGDAAAFRSDLAHSYANAGSAPTSFSLAVSEPAAAGHGSAPTKGD